MKMCECGSMLSYLLSMLISFVLGCTSSLVVWYFTVGIFVPKIEICKEIARTRQSDGKCKYQIKIINKSFKRDAFQINIYYRIRYRGIYFTINAPEIPILSCGKKNKDNFDNERLIPINLMGIRKNKVEGFGEEEKLLEKYRRGTLEFEDFFTEDFNFEIVLSAFASISGSRLFMNVCNYNAEELKEVIKDGIYNKGEKCVFVRDSSYIEYDNNC